MDRVGPPKRLRAHFGKTEKAHLPGRDQLSHSADRFLDRNLRIAPVLVEKIDRLDA